MTYVAAALSVAECAPRGTALPALPVAPTAETVAVATTNADAADDPAIWAAAAGRTVMLGGRSVPGFVAGTDKKAGLYIYGLDGAQLQFLPEGLLNNVDLRAATVAGREQVVIGASDRGRMGVALYLFDAAAREAGNAVRPFGFIKSDVVEPYGFCMGRWNDALHAILVAKDGAVRIYRLALDGAEATGAEVARFAVGSQSEGCVVDEAGGQLYIGEELKGVWRYPLADPTSRVAIDSVGEGRLVADVEGVAMIEDAGRRFLLVSSQGDSAFAVWRIDGAAPAYVGRFLVAAAAGIDAVTGTDGIDARGGAVGPFPEGLVVVQDDENEGMSQNFKLIDWREVKRALGL